MQMRGDVGYSSYAMLDISYVAEQGIQVSEVWDLREGKSGEEVLVQGPDDFPVWVFADGVLLVEAFCFVCPSIVSRVRSNKHPLHRTQQVLRRKV